MKKIFVALFIMILGSTMIGGCSSISIPETAAGKPPAHAASYDKKVGSVATTDTTTDNTTSSTTDTTTSSTTSSTTSPTTDTATDTTTSSTTDTTTSSATDTQNEIDSIDYDLYVSVNGNDANSGTKSSPFRTIQKAANVAKPGDKIWIGGGTYKEFVTINVSGTAGSPIVFRGERGSNGEYKTIIDPGTPISNWVPASEVGAGVYKSNLGFEPREMTVGGKRIGKINKTLMGSGDGFKLLNMGADEEVKLLDTSILVKFWDGVEAIYGYKDNITYIRFRKGDNPNDKAIKAAPAGAAIVINNKSHLTLSGLAIQGAEFSVSITGAGSANNIVEDCILKNGRKRVYITNGPSNTIVRNNSITMDYYAGNDCLGAEVTSAYVKRHVYDFFKHIVGSSTSDDSGVELINPGANTVISGNHIFGGLLGIPAYNRGVDSPVYGLKIFNNKIHNMSSVGITSNEGIMDVEINNNLIYDCNLNIRIHELNKKTDLGRRVYIYNNSLWNPEGGGYHFYIHSAATAPAVNFPEYWIYNNFCVGGNRSFGVMEAVVLSGGMPEFYIFNNTFLAKNNFSTNLINCINKTNYLGFIDYNSFGGLFPKSITGSIFGVNNVFFSGDDTYLKFPDIASFLEEFDRNSYEIKRLDISGTFSINNSDYMTLPYCENTWNY